MQIIQTAGLAINFVRQPVHVAMPIETGVILGFGVLNGAGIGLGYSATAPAAVKWFKPEQKGLIVGHW
ncbi:hypothetical protein ACTL6P_18595 [Endozoicomonas acroporae]|uniref:hypothetical protein n=1 Tax=Endozoicomonas acroporae TaxID=1701104 RepID=UPI0015E06D6F|nr:hypothetical protein [Endozoicomonas acroporae]